VITKSKARLFGVALAALSAFSMVATPAYSAAPSGKRVTFQTSAPVLEYVKINNPELYHRLIQYRSGQRVHVTAREHAYLKKLNRMVAVAAKQRAAAQYEFSSQARVSKEARAAYAQAAVTVTPEPWWVRWENIFKTFSGAGVILAPLFPVIAPVMVVITIILVILEAIAKIAEAATKK